MANYKKSFNFRNGVQVDDDNFIVNANGLVGIGTSVPRELLDVYGTLQVTGIVTATEISTPKLTLPRNLLNVGITSITSGIISATSGLVTYYGDGSKLLNLPTSQWVDVDPGFGFTSIYAVGNVGIATTNPQFNFQVGANPLSVTSGIGINSTGDVYSAGIITASSFSGSGANLSSLNASNITSGTLSNSILPSTISITSFSGSGAALTSLNATNITSGTLSTSIFPSNITLSGIITATSFVGNLTGTATTASTIAPSGTISVTSVNSGFTSTGIATITDTLYVVGFPAKIGVGTNSAPEANIEVNRPGISSIRVISTNNVATIGIGRSAEIRTGNTNTFYLYSNRNSLDIINSNPENLNYYLDYGSAGLGTGNFNWIYGQNPSNPLMTLTYGGNLGLGITDPPSRLYVVGSSYITGITTIDSNLNVSNTINATDINFTGTLTGDLGITTFSRLGIATNSISGNSYEFFVGGDPVFGPGVAITATGIRASGNIQSSNLTVTNADITNINSTGVITATTFNGTLVGTVSTAIDATNVRNGYVDNASYVSIGTTDAVDFLQVQRYCVGTGIGTFIASAGISTDIDSFVISFSDFKTAEYTVHIEYGTYIQTQKVLVMQNGTTAYSQEYGIMYEPSKIVSIGATISGEECILRVTPETGISGLTTYRFVRGGLL